MNSNQMLKEMLEGMNDSVRLREKFRNLQVLKPGRLVLAKPRLSY